MKTDTAPANRSLKKIICVVGLVAVASLSLSLRAYVDSDRSTQRLERGTALIAYLNDTLHIHHALHQLPVGASDALGQQLASQITGHLVEIRLALPGADEASQTFTRNAYRHIAMEIKTHPETYLSPSPGARASEIKAWQTAIDEAPPINDVRVASAITR